MPASPTSKELKTFLHRNLGSVGLYVLIVTILLYFAYIFSNNIYNAIITYREIVGGDPPLESKIPGSVALMNSQLDNEPTNSKSDVPLVDEYNAFKSTISQMRVKYNDYNKSIIDHHLLHNTTPEDVIDKSVLLSQYDNYSKK